MRGPKKYLTSDEHRDLRRLASTGVKLKRLASIYNISISTAFNYKYNMPEGGDWTDEQTSNHLQAASINN